MAFLKLCDLIIADHLTVHSVLPLTLPGFKRKDVVKFGSQNKYKSNDLKSEYLLYTLYTALSILSLYSPLQHQRVPDSIICPVP